MAIYLRKLNILYVLLLSVLIPYNANAAYNRAACNLNQPAKVYQNPIRPIHLWNFDENDVTQSSVSVAKLSFISNSIPLNNFVQFGGQTSNYLSLNADAPNFVQYSQTDPIISDSFAIEFSIQFKTDSFKYLGTNDYLTLANFVSTKSSGQVNVRMNSNSILFSVDTLNANPDPSVPKIDTLTINLNEVDRKSLNYYLDGRPHHFVFNRNSELGIMQIWVDGVLATGFSQESTCGDLKAPLNTFRFNQYILNRKLIANLDNIALFNTDLPEAAIVQHYSDFIAGRTISFQYNPNQVSQSAPNIPLEYDLQEYAPGTYFPSNSAWTEGAFQRPEEQLEQFPIPRFKPIQTPLKANFNWMQPHYMAGLGRPWLYDTCTNCTNSSLRDAFLTEKIKQMNKELVLNWNFGITLHFFPAKIAAPTVKSALDSMLLYPEAARHAIGFTPLLYYQNGVSNEYLLKDNNGNPFLGRSNEQIASPVQPYLSSTTRVQSFATDKAIGTISASGLLNDALKQYKEYLDLNGDARKGLTNFSSFDLINENGEFAGVNWWPEYISQDPAVRNDERNFYARTLGISPNLVPLLNAVTSVATEPLENLKRWDSYRGFAMARIGNAFRDSMFQKASLCSPIKSCALKFSLYSVQGNGSTSGSSSNYQQYRKINSSYSGVQWGCDVGKTCYYSTADFYPNLPSRWLITSGNAHGMNWLLDGRRNEIALGDRMFTPFVNAHFKFKEEIGLRPGQYLGVLKLLGIMGVEHYYAGFFSTGQNIIGIPGLSFQDPKNWVWQVSTPSYAQAIASRYEDVLRKGDLIDRPIDNQSDKPRYDFATRTLDSNGNDISSDPNIMTLVRKYENKYVIATSIQRQSNFVGNSLGRRMVAIDLKDGSIQKTLKFESRLQGSVYVYDVTNPSSPLFYQLDKWHEYKHPSHWNRAISLEAELYDLNQYQTINLKTETPESTQDGDYRLSSTFLSVAPGTFLHPNLWMSYYFQPRIENKTPTSFDIWVKVRSKSGVGSLNLKVNALNRKVTSNLITQQSIGVQVGSAQTVQTSSNKFVWIKATQSIPNLISNTNYILQTRPLNEQVEIDQYYLCPSGCATPAEN